MFESVLGETGGTIAQFILALIVVLLLIMLVAWLVRRFGVGRLGGAYAAQAELEVITSLAIDQKRKLVLVRQGKLEHLLLIGGGSDEVIERSMVGGIPIAARMQANKSVQNNPDDNAPAAPARQTNGMRAAKDFTNAVSRKPADDAPSKARSSGLGSTLAASASLAAGGLTATAATLSGKAKGAAVRPGASPKSSAIPDAGPSSPEPARDPVFAVPTSEAEPASAQADKAAPEPTKPTAPQPEPEPQAALARTAPKIDPKTEPNPAVDLGSNLTPQQVPQDERKTLEQSLDDALSESLLEPQVPSSPTGPSDLDLERELEAALDLDSFDEDPSSDGVDVMAGLPPLPDLSALSDDPVTDNPEPAQNAAKASDQAAQPEERPSEVSEATTRTLDPLSLESVRASREKSSDTATADLPGEKPEEPSSALDIPVELSGRTTPPIPVTIPSRGPASSATTLAKAEDEAKDDAVAVAETQTAETADSPKNATTTDTGSDDLDNEMRRLLGEIAGDPEKK